MGLNGGEVVLGLRLDDSINKIPVDIISRAADGQLQSAAFHLCPTEEHLNDLCQWGTVPPDVPLGCSRDRSGEGHAHNMDRIPL